MSSAPVGLGQADQRGERRSRNAVIPSCASSDAKRRAESSTISSPYRSMASRTPRLARRFELDEPLWRGLEQVCGESRDRTVDVVGGDGDQPDALRLGGVERGAGEVVAGGGAIVEAGEHRHGDDCRSETDPRFRDGEGAARSGDGDVACADQADPACSYVTVNSGDNGLGNVDDEAQHREQRARGAGHRTGGRLREVGARAEGCSRVGQHQCPDAGIGARSLDMSRELGDELPRERVAVLRRIERHRRDAALHREMDEFRAGHRSSSGMSMDRERSHSPSALACGSKRVDDATPSPSRPSMTKFSARRFGRT